MQSHRNSLSSVQRKPRTCLSLNSRVRYLHRSRISFYFAWFLSFLFSNVFYRLRPLCFAIFLPTKIQILSMLIVLILYFLLSAVSLSCDVHAQSSSSVATEASTPLASFSAHTMSDDDGDEEDDDDDEYDDSDFYGCNSSDLVENDCIRINSYFFGQPTQQFPRGEYQDLVERQPEMKVQETLLAKVYAKVNGLFASGLCEKCFQTAYFTCDKCLNKSNDDCQDSCNYCDSCRSMPHIRVIANLHADFFHMCALLDINQKQKENFYVEQCLMMRDAQNHVSQYSYQLVLRVTDPLTIRWEEVIAALEYILTHESANDQLTDVTEKLHEYAEYKNISLLHAALKFLHPKPFWNAHVEYFNKAFTKLLIAGENPNNQNKDDTVLQVFLEKGSQNHGIDLKMVGTLLRYGANPRARRARDSRTMLHIALENGATCAVIMALLSKLQSTDLNSIDNDCMTPLHVAVGASRDYSTLKTLVDRGANKLAFDKFGRLPYDLVEWGIFGDDQTRVKILLQPRRTKEDDVLVY